MATNVTHVQEFSSDTCKDLKCLVTFNITSNTINHTPGHAHDGIECELTLNDGEFSSDLVFRFTQAIHLLTRKPDEGLIFRQYFHFNQAVTDRLNNRLDPTGFEFVQLMFDNGLIDA